MNNIKKLIFKTQTESIAPPFSYFFDITRGTQACIGGFVDITPIEDVGVYSTVNRPDWDVGTQLYSDAYLTVNLPDGFYRSVTGGTIDKFFFSVTSGVVTEKILVNTGC